MKGLFGLLLLALALSGCVTKSKARTQAQAAFMAGQGQATVQAQQADFVFVQGQVQNPRVPWNEDLTLAKAIVAAGYRGFMDPREIRIIRKGEVFRIDPKRLLRGQEDPPLEPGDVIELRR